VVKFTLRLAALALVLSAAAGCVQLRQELTIRADNTGSFALRLAVPAARYETLVAGEAAAMPSLRPLFDPAQGDTYFPAADGFVVRAHRVYTDGEWRQLTVEGEITDLKKALASGRLGAFTLNTADGVSTLKLDPAGLGPADPAAAPAARREALRELLAGLHIQLVVRTPTPIVATTAPDKEDRLAVWTFDLEDHRDFLEKTPDIHVRW
jgi:hypothetical protein